MKKSGFTLAEVLITLGIIGVVAALTAPSLVQNAGTAQVGPKLAKASSTFQVAAENLLTAEESTKLSAIVSGVVNSNEKANLLGERLGEFMKITPIDDTTIKTKWIDTIVGYNGGSWTSEKNLSNSSYGSQLTGGCALLSSDGMIYYIRQRTIWYPARLAQQPHKQCIGTLTIDINGFSKPNKVAKDVFQFTLWNDGSLRPVGSTGWDKDGTGIEDDKMHWTKLCNETSVTSGWACAGAIFENNLKVIYE